MADRASIGKTSRPTTSAPARRSKPAAPAKAAAAPPQARRTEVAQAPAQTRGDSATISADAKKPPAAASSVPNFQASLGEPQPSGSAAVDLARQFEGRDSQSIKGELPNFTAAGGRDNNCADFVSSVLKSTGQFQGHDIRVKDFKANLIEQGYSQIPASEARPGDVFFANKGSHTELVTEAGGARTIGSNNVEADRQAITERPKDPTTGTYYARREALAETMVASR